MNLTFLRENRTSLRVLLFILLCLASVVLLYVAIFGNPLRRESAAAREVAATKTAIAQTAQALLGPFPTSTAPTLTPSDTPTVTSTIPTATPSATRTSTSTPTPLVTATLRTREPFPTRTNTSTPVQPTFPFRPTATRTPVPPTATQPPPATDTQAPPPTATENIITLIPTLVETLFP